MVPTDPLSAAICATQPPRPRPAASQTVAVHFAGGAADDRVFPGREMVGPVRRALAAELAVAVDDVVFRVGHRVLEDDSAWLGSAKAPITVIVRPEPDDARQAHAVAFARTGEPEFVLRFAAGASAGDARARVARRFLVPAAAVTLIHRGRAVRDTVALAGLPAKIAVHVREGARPAEREVALFSPRRGVRVNVLRRACGGLVLWVAPQETALGLKAAVARAAECPIGGFEIVANGRVLRRNDTLDGADTLLMVHPHAPPQPLEEPDPWEEALYETMSVSTLVRLREAKVIPERCSEQYGIVLMLLADMDVDRVIEWIGVSAK
jgi:hypothetical protein